ncbi:hypothetical protein FIBSPDRAFT_689773, partial [Athelia psychrophila]
HNRRSAADISELNHDITRLQRAIEELLRKRTALQCFENDHKSHFNHVARFPAEVLSQIYQCIVVPWSEGSLYGRFDKTPLMVASVNRHWRNVALSTPRLWSAVALTL